MNELPKILEEKAATDWKLVVAYDGTDYHGWQIQPNLPTIQQTLAHAIQSITGESILPQGSGRTDSGVHAYGQVASLRLKVPIPAQNLQRALNRILPSAIRIISATPHPEGFHARLGVVSKTYQYRIFVRRPDQMQERVCSPEKARFVWDCPLRLAVDKMQAAATQVIGTHDFTSFAAYDPDRAARIRAAELAEDKSESPDNIRTIFHSAWTWQDQELVYTVNGSGFLHHMVRNLVGTFIEIGTGRLPENAVPQILQARHRGYAGATAQPQGLALREVFYAREQA